MRKLDLLVSVIAGLVLALAPTAALAEEGAGDDEGRTGNERQAEARGSERSHEVRASGQSSRDQDGDADDDPDTRTEDDDRIDDEDDGIIEDDIPDDGDNRHPSGKDRSVEPDNAGKAESTPDQDGNGPERDEGGTDKPDGPGGEDESDQDGNNGCGNDDDFDDDNEGWCGKPVDDDVEVDVEEEDVEAASVEGVSATRGGIDAEVAGPTGVTVGGQAVGVAATEEAQVLGVTLERPAAAPEGATEVAGSEFVAAPTGRAVAAAEGTEAAPLTLARTGIPAAALGLTALGLVALGGAIRRAVRSS